MIRVHHLRAGVDDDMLAAAYLRMKVEGLLEYLFWAGPPSLVAFLEWCHKPDMILAGVFVESEASPAFSSPTLDPPVLDLAGFGFLSDIKTYGAVRCGDVGEIFFRHYQVIGSTQQLGEALLEFAFQTCKMTTICGITPERNFAARRFMRHMGFTEMGVIPNLCCLLGEPCGGCMSYLTFDSWATQLASQRATQLASRQKSTQKLEHVA